ncbi:MAG: hypothetical protein AAF211_18630 [Myxococcota bacterium]
MRSVAALSALVMLLPGPCRESSEPVPRCKCGSRLTVYVLDPSGGVRSLPDGALLGEGDTIQVGYWVTGGHTAILSVDGRGVVTTHLPAPGEAIPWLARRGVLDHGFRLDDAPDYERFFLVVDDVPLDLASIRARVREDRIRDDPRLADEFEIRKPPHRKAR